MARRPRVMALREVQRIRTIDDGCVWLELYAGIVPVFIEFSAGGLTFMVGTAFRGYRTWCENKWYNKTWRIWTRKPTDEERRAEGWDIRGHYEDQR